MAGTYSEGKHNFPLTTPVVLAQLDKANAIDRSRKLFFILILVQRKPR
jgi:hypothetical protein